MVSRRVLRITSYVSATMGAILLILGLITLYWSQLRIRLESNPNVISGYPFTIPFENFIGHILLSGIVLLGLSYLSLRRSRKAQE